MTISVLNEILVNLASNDFRVNQAYAGDVYDINTKENRFGCFVATPMTATRNEGGVITYHYVMYYIDRLTEVEDNIDLVQTDAVSVLKRVIDNLGYQGIEMGEGYQFTLFKHQFDDWCAGAYVDIDFIVPDMDCQEFEIGKTVDLRPITITENGTYLPDGFDGFSSVFVNVEGGSDVTREWVEDYVTSQGYATEDYVNNSLKGYVDDERFDKNITDINAALDKKLQDGDLKTINGESLIGEGDIVIKGESKPKYVITATVSGTTGTVTSTNEEVLAICTYLSQNGIDSADVVLSVSNYECVATRKRITTSALYLDFQQNKTYLALLITFKNGVINSKRLTVTVYLVPTDLNSYATTASVDARLDGVYTTIDLVSARIPNNVSQLTNDAGYLTEHQPLKTVNGESLVGEGDIEIHGGEVDLPDYLKDNFIQFTGEEDAEYTQLTGNGLQFSNKGGFSGYYEPGGFSIWNNDRERGINGGDEGISSSSGAYGSTWMGAIYMPGDEEPDHYGLQVWDVEGTHIAELNNNGITFWDYDQTTEEGEIDWDNPTITDITKEELIEVKNISNKADRSELAGYATKGEIPTIPENVSAFNNDAGYLTEHQDISGKVDKTSIWTGTQAQWDALTDAQKASYIIALIRA